jgi:hypothetical protein
MPSPPNSARAASTAVFCLALTAALASACTTVYQPPEADLTDASLESAIHVLEETEAGIEMLEDGLQLLAYLYLWRAPIDRGGFYGDTRFGSRSDFSSDQPMRLLVGPARELYVPYARIKNVSARSWPLWSGVEIEVTESPDLAVDGPLVVEADDVEEAQRLTDAIDTIRRVRLLSAAIDPAAVDPAGVAPPE